MNIDHLVKMANQIGAFYEAPADRDQALADLAGHLKNTWTPAMRATLFRHADSLEAGGLREIVRLALARHGDRLA